MHGTEIALEPAMRTDTALASSRTRKGLPQGALRVGLLGCGRVAEYHAGFLKPLKNATLVGVADTNSTAAHAFAEHHGVPNVYSSLEELLNATPIDALHVLTPPFSHYECARQALDRGIHVLVEKPMALSSAQVTDLYERAAKNGLYLCPDYPQLFHPKMEKVMNLIQSGQLGRVAHVESHLTLRLDIPELRDAVGLPWSFRLPGGLLHNYITHPLYLVLALAGQPKSVNICARSFGSLPQELADDLVVNIDGADCTASVHLSFLPQPAVYDVRIYCEGGTVSVDFETQTMVVSTPGSLPRSLQRAASPIALGWRYSRESIANIVDFLRGRLVPYAGLQVLISRFYDSITNGGPAPISPELAVSVSEVEDAIVQHHAKWHLDLTPRPSRLSSSASKGKVLLTGAAGYVGFRVAKKLLADGYYVRALVRPTNHVARLEQLGAEVVFGDIRSRDDVAAAAEGMDAVVHLAAALRGRREVILQTCVEGTRNVAEAATRHNIKRVVYLSSMAVYDFLKARKQISDDTPLESAPEFRSAYAWAKRLAEDVALSHLGDNGPSWTVLRPSYVIGGDRNLLAALGPKIGPLVICLGGPGKRLRLIHVDDLSAAIARVLENEATRGKVFNISDLMPVSSRKYWKAVRKVSGGKVRMIYVPYVFARTGALALNTLSRLKGKGPRIHTRQLRYLFNDSIPISDSLCSQTGWQPRKNLVGDLVSEQLSRQSTARQAGGAV